MATKKFWGNLEETIVAVVDEDGRIGAFAPEDVLPKPQASTRMQVQAKPKLEPMTGLLRLCVDHDLKKWKEFGMVDMTPEAEKQYREERLWAIEQIECCIKDGEVPTEEMFMHQAKPFDCKAELGHDEACKMNHGDIKLRTRPCTVSTGVKICDLHKHHTS